MDQAQNNSDNEEEENVDDTIEFQNAEEHIEDEVLKFISQQYK